MTRCRKGEESKIRTGYASVDLAGGWGAHYPETVLMDLSFTFLFPFPFPDPNMPLETRKRLAADA